MSMADDFTLGTDFSLVPTDSLIKRFDRAELSSQSPSDKQVTSSEEAKKSVNEKRPLHRIAEVRKLQGISIRSASRRMGIPMEQVRREEKPDSNLTMEDLVRWQQALEVPMIDLLVDENAPLSTPVLARAKWLRIMKTVKALLETTESANINRMARMLEDQVLEVMPELKDVSAWHSVGQRRTQDEVGRIAESPVASNFASDGLR